MPAIVVIAKAPVPGRVKTRLCPPCTPEQAAGLAAAALADTLQAALGAGAERVMLALDGAPPPWLPDVGVVPQRGRGLAERLAAAFEDVGGPALLVGMDTPQVTSALLADGLERLRAGAPAVLGPALDGGYWAIGLRRADGRVFARVPMSRPETGAAQLARLIELGLTPALLPALRDVDVMADAAAVAAAAPGGRFARALGAQAPRASSSSAQELMQKR
jgi:rSAM/selenodomain-associated transferase 1